MFFLLASHLSYWTGAIWSYSGSQLDWRAETESEFSQNKTLVWVIATAGIDPGCLIFDKLMRGFIWKNYKVKIPAIEDSLSNICWGCGKDAEDIRQVGDKPEVVREKEKGKGQVEEEAEDNSKDKALMICKGCGVAR